MAGTITHVAIADKIYCILGKDKIKNLPLFFGGNLAPDAIHAKKDYQRIDKKRSHLCEGINAYGYLDSEVAKLFKDRVNEFIENYYLTAGDDKDLYLGYITHLLADEYHLLEIYKYIEKYAISNGANPNELGFRENLQKKTINGGIYEKLFADISDTLNIHNVNQCKYDFKQNAVDILESVWDYEIKDYISAEQINISKRWVIDTFFKTEPTEDNQYKNNVADYDYDSVLKLIDNSAEDIIASLSGKKDIIKIL